MTTRGAQPASDGVEAGVTRNIPEIEVEILPDTHAFINGKEVKPGKRAWVDGPAALHLVSLGHAKITGSR